MTELVKLEDGSSFLVIEQEEDDVCELCGSFEETRPYGPNGEEVCFDCAMKDEEAAKKQFYKLMLEVDLETPTIH